MFYCDICAKENHYPIMFHEKYKSLGPCEICHQRRSCNDFRHDELKFKDKTVFIGNPKHFLKPKNNFVKAPKGCVMNVFFDTNQLKGDDKLLIILAYKVKIFNDKNKAIIEMNQARKTLIKNNDWKGTKMGFIYDDKGDLVKCH